VAAVAVWVVTIVAWAIHRYADKKTAEFLKFIAAILIPALIAGLFIQQTKGALTIIAVAWLAATLLSIWHAVDGLKGARDLLFGSLSSWAVTLAVGLLRGLMPANSYE
jgi:hypothetical protein